MFDNGDKELARLPIVTIQDVLMARMIARNEAARMGFTAQALTQIATAVSEIARNVVQHAQAAGRMRLSEATEDGRVGLRIAIEDDGRGIENLDLALAGVSPGAGIPGCRKLVDDFALHSTLGAGTEITMTKWVPTAFGGK